MKSHAELAKRQLQVLPYLLSCPTYEKLARQARVSVKQIYCWLKTSAFKVELDRRHNEIIEEAVNKLKYNTTKSSRHAGFAPFSFKSNDSTWRS